jgi:hypothetical protein
MPTTGRAIYYVDLKLIGIGISGSTAAGSLNQHNTLRISTIDGVVTTEPADANPGKATPPWSFTNQQGVINVSSNQILFQLANSSASNVSTWSWKLSVLQLITPP